MVLKSGIKLCLTRRCKMDKGQSIKLFESKKVRVQWNQAEEKWYFSIVDVIEILTGSSIPRRYWSDLKIKLKEEGFELYEKIVQLKLFPIALQLDSERSKFSLYAGVPDTIQRKARRFFTYHSASRAKSSVRLFQCPADYLLS